MGAGAALKGCCCCSCCGGCCCLWRLCDDSFRAISSVSLLSLPLSAIPTKGASPSRALAEKWFGNSASGGFYDSPP